MKNLIYILLTILVSNTIYCQLPYTWTTGINPGWTSNNGVLSWKPGCTVVTTNCTGNYANNTNSVYTSNTINASCSNATTILITFTVSGDAEFGYDFLFVEYSLDNGVTWINPYGVLNGWTGNFGAGSTIPPIITPTSSTFRFRFNFQSDGIFRSSGYKITDFDIVCNTSLPVELAYFKGYNKNNINTLEWKTISEQENNYFEIYQSENTIDWKLIGTINGNGNTNFETIYYLNDYNYNQIINYYKLVQVDNNGTKTNYDIITINNKLEEQEIINITNTLGQKIDDNYKGIILITYSNGRIEKILR